MLRRLTIQNIVLIEQAELAFDGGLSVLSGETGAGKSILLDALGLALGARADSALVRRGEAGGMVSAEFDIAGRSDIKHVLAELGLEADDQIIIRRSLSSDGKTRALVNDQPVTVTALKKLGELLIEIHGQHDQRGLQDRSVHRDLLDGFGKLGTERTKVAGCYGAWRECMRAVAALEAEITQAEREQDYLNHMRGELKALNPKAGEEESLSDQRTRMMQSEKLFDVLNEAMNELSSPSPMSQRVRSVLRTLTRSPLTSSESFASALDALDKAACLLDEAQESLEAIGREASFDPVKLEAIEERLFALKAAGRKYNLPVEELVLLKEQVNDKLALLAAQAERLASLRKKESEARKSLIEAATNLSEKRRIVATRLEKAVMSELKPLKMDGTKFHVKIEMQSEEHWSEAGLDIVEFTQVLVVTHLPQVAARGAQHIKVSKQEKSGKVTTSVKTLSAKEREEELARMLAGATITPEARKAAQKLLEQAA